MAETAIVVPCMLSDPIIGLWRARYTADGRDGMPAHITLLYPWIEQENLVASDISKVRDVLATFGAFDFALTSIASFPPPPMVLYLRSEPQDTFIKMTEALAAAFLERPPYGGEFEEIVPHATIVETDPNPSLESEVRRSVQRHLPIREHANEVWIMAYRQNRWWRESALGLAPSG